MFDIVSKFHAPAGSPLTTVRGALEVLRPLANWLGTKDPLLSKWFLGGQTLEAALQHQAFVDEVNGHTACVALLEASAKKTGDVGIMLWNGQNSPETKIAFGFRSAAATVRKSPGSVFPDLSPAACKRSRPTAWGCPSR